MGEQERERLLTPEQVAAIFQVTTKTVGVWARQGRVRFITTPAGWRKYPESQFRDVAITVNHDE